MFNFATCNVDFVITHHSLVLVSERKLIDQTVVLVITGGEGLLIALVIVTLNEI